MSAPTLLARTEPTIGDRITARLTDVLETINLGFEARELPDDGRHEPPAASTARRIDGAEVAHLDPERADFIPDPEPPRRRVLGGPVGSLLLHLLPLLALVTWLRPPLEIPPPIPIQLVVEQPPPPPPAPTPAPPKPKAEPKPPPGLRASEDMGEVGPPKPEKGTETEPPTQGAPPQPPAPAPETKPADAAPEPPPAPTQVAAALPPPPLAPPKPAPPKKEAAMRLPKPDGLTLPLPIYPNQHTAATRSGKVPGPDASRDEYCAYALTLTLKHMDLLPRSFVGARHGDTAVAIVLRSDGSINSVRVLRGSNYEDIDEKVVQMVWAVGRFPPLPAWVPGPQAQFTFHLHFPNAVEQ